MGNEVDLKKLNIGDRIILISGANNNSNFEGIIGTIYQKSTHYYSVKDEKGVVFNVFHGTGGYNTDSFCLATRKEKATALKKKLHLLKEEVKSIQKEVDYLEKYETEEDYLAEKLIQLMEAKDKKGMVTLLKEMRKTDHL